MNELQTSLSKCRIEGNTLFLPTEMLSNYKDVRQALLNAGASYKRNTFVFPNDAQPYIDRLMGGDKVNIKKQFQFFGTPQSEARNLAKLANLKTYYKILEPSAGQAAIVNAIVEIIPSAIVDVCELMDINKSILDKNPNAHFICDDFLQIPDKYLGYYDRVVANPPFNKNQDISHIRKMYDCLKPGGRLVSISSKHWQMSQNKKETEFRNWLKEINADVQEIEAGAFKESGTMISSLIIVINKK